MAQQNPPRLLPARSAGPTNLGGSGSFSLPPLVPPNRGGGRGAGAGPPPPPAQRPAAHPLGQSQPQPPEPPQNTKPAHFRGAHSVGEHPSPPTNRRLNTYNVSPPGSGAKPPPPPREAGNRHTTVINPAPFRLPTTAGGKVSNLFLNSSRIFIFFSCFSETELSIMFVKISIKYLLYQQHQYSVNRFFVFMLMLSFGLTSFVF